MSEQYTEAQKAAAFEWLRNLPDRTGQITQHDREQADIALRVWLSEAEDNRRLRGEQ